ncbi:MAG TPA: type II toxin-antitoxin system VapC family toxin [Candidatus Acidoferrum sp.]|nr:type II toxin-antitoxin system VapC family toxin [Candidatus Acidoferrum sp.]
MGQFGLILLDTHVVLWVKSDSARLSPKAKARIEKARHAAEGLAISGITLLELATLASKGRIRLTIGLESMLQEIESQFVVLPISSRACARTLELPASYPKDPADRLIGATALVEGLALVTADADIRRSSAVHTIW